MDFIFNLPKTKDNKTPVLVVVDKLSKIARFIPLESNNTEKHIANMFYKEIYKHRGLPHKIISDRENLFTSDFRRHLMSLLQVKLNISSSFHPETDGQSERTFRKIEEMIRCFVSYAQKDWPLLLPVIEVAYNNYENECTKQTSFFLEYGQHPITISNVLRNNEKKVTPTTIDVEYFIHVTEKAVELAREAIKVANIKQAEQYNKTVQNMSSMEKIVYYYLQRTSHFQVESKENLRTNILALLRLQKSMHRNDVTNFSFHPNTKTFIQCFIYPSSNHIKKTHTMEKI